MSCSSSIRAGSEWRGQCNGHPTWYGDDDVTCSPLAAWGVARSLTRNAVWHGRTEMQRVKVRHGIDAVCALGGGGGDLSF
jgi:hypothetical protein